MVTKVKAALSFPAAQIKQQLEEIITNLVELSTTT
jgi:hypothetical protein